MNQGSHLTQREPGLDRIGDYHISFHDPLGENSEKNMLERAGKPKILIVDDDPLFLKVTSDFLSEKKFQVITVRSANDALIVLKNADFDLVLSDIIMPEMDGIDLLRTIRTEHPDTDVVLATGKADLASATEAIQLGAYDYLIKPVDLDELLWRLEKALEKNRLRKVEREYKKNLKDQILEQGDRLRYLFYGAIETLVNAIEAKDSYTKGHSLRVTEYSIAFSKALKLSFAEASNIQLAARLHDIGKLSISEFILNKPSTLTDDEFALIKYHPEMGCDILGPILEDEVLVTIRHHHENWDGTGYPSGLSGEKIPLGAKIVCLADCFDAMTSDRSYKTSMSPEEAFQEIRACAGFKFDPDLALHFIDVMKAHLRPEL